MAQRKTKTDRQFLMRAAMTPHQSIARLMLAIVVTMLTSLTAWADETTASLGDYEFTIGSDDEGQYYKVGSCEDLNALASYVNSGGTTAGLRFKMTADIAFTHTSTWNDRTSNENNFDRIGFFGGTFDGAGHTISGIRIYQANSSKQGLFGTVSGLVKGVTLTDTRITGGDHVGGIAGYLYNGSISDCHVTGTVALCNHVCVYSGGIVGRVVGSYYNVTISGCTSSVTIISDGMAGEWCGAITGEAQLSVTLSHNLAIRATIPGANRNLYGAIAGDDGGKHDHNYYFGCDVAGSSTNVGIAMKYEGRYYHSTDIPGARLALPVNGGNNVTVALPTGSENGFTYGGATYVGAGERTALSLSYGGTVGDGQTVAYSDSYGRALWPNADGTYTLDLGDDATQPVTITAQVVSAAIPGTWTGTGSSADPYTIHNSTQLDQLAADVNAGNSYANTYFQLGADIAYNPGPAVNFTPIGNADHAFLGHFSGNGYAISGIRTGSADADCQALFGHIGSGATLSIFLDDAVITGSSNIGALVGLNDGGTLTANYYHGCTVGDATTGIGTASGDITTDDGAVSLSKLTVRDGLAVTSTPTVTAAGTGYYKEGAAVGFSYGGTAPEGYVQDFFVSSEVSDVVIQDVDFYAEYSYSCVLSGVDGGGTFNMPATDATLRFGNLSVTPYEGSGTADAPYLIRYASQFSFLVDDRNKNRFDTYFQLAKDIVFPHTTDWDDATSTEDNFSNYFHVATQHAILYCHLDGGGYTVSGIRIYRGGAGDTSATDLTCEIGVFERLSSSGSISNLTLADTRVTGYQKVGALVGHNEGGTISYCRVAGDVAVHTVQPGAMYHGGIVGFNFGGTYPGGTTNYNGTIDHCVSSAKLTVKDGIQAGTYYGGIVGSSTGTLSNNFAIDAVVPATEKDYLGAISGDNANGQHNYYYNCTVAGMNSISGVGAGLSDENWADNTWAVAPLTLGSGITASAPGEPIFTYNGTDYYSYGCFVTLNGGLPEGSPVERETDGYVLDFNGRSLLVTKSPADDSYVFSMPEASTTIRAVRKAHPWTGSGTAADPYIITTTEGLDLLATLVSVGNLFSDTHFRLGADITYPTTTAWNSDAPYVSNYTAIGGYYPIDRLVRDNRSTDTRRFDGTFNGAGHTISGIRILKVGINEFNRSEGVFGWLNKNATVSGITLANACITGTTYVGGIAACGLSGSTITNCHVADDVAIKSFSDVNGSQHGGIAGHTLGTISHCSSAAAFTSADNANGYVNICGGITGFSSGTLSHNLVVGSTFKGYTSPYAIIPHTSNCTIDHNYYGDCIIDGTATPSGIGTRDGDVTANDGAVPATILYDHGTKASGNADAIDAVNGTAHVALYGRKLYKDGDWNTLCLPFGVSDFTGTPLEGATVMELDATGTYDTDKKTGFDAESGTLYLYFKPATEIVAGRPYIVKWTKPDGYDLAPYDHDIYNPVFSSAAIDNSSEAQARNTVSATNSGLNTVQFIGSYNPVALTPNDKSNLFLGAASTLYYPNAANNADGKYYINACRAYFHVDLTGAPNVRALVLNIGDGEASGIVDAEANSSLFTLHSSLSEWYTLDGRKLGGKPSQKGLYIHGSRKVVIK